MRFFMSIPSNIARITQTGQQIQIQGSKTSLETNNKFVAIVKNIFGKECTVHDPINEKKFYLSKKDLVNWLFENPGFYVDREGSKLVIKKNTENKLQNLLNISDRNLAASQILKFILEMPNDKDKYDAIKETLQDTNITSQLYNSLEGLKFELLQKHPNYQMTQNNYE